MKMKKLFAVVLLGALAATSAHAQTPPQMSPTATPVNSQGAPQVGVDVPSIEQRKLAQFDRHAKELVIWSQPVMGVAQTRSAIRKLGGSYNDVVYLSKPSNWKFRILTPNSQVLYVAAVTNTAKDGPVVMEIPPATTDTAIFGTIMDSFQVPREDVGAAGADKGKGGKYLLLPAKYKGKVPAGYIPVSSERNIGYHLFRTIPKTFEPKDIEAAIALTKQIRIYPLSMAGKPPQQKFIDTYDKIFDTVDPTNSSYFQVLTEILNEETVLEQDKFAMRMLETLGYWHGKTWVPNSETLARLDVDVVLAMNELVSMLSDTGPEYWKGSHWRVPAVPRSMSTQFSFKNDKVFDYYERGLTYSWACCAPKYLGKGTFYLVGTVDGAGDALSGGQRYKLTVPANVPVKQFWSVMVYGANNGVYLENAEKIGISSFDDLQKNADGTVDVYFGPKAPKGQESNWLPTKDGEPFFLLFRFYGPTEAVAAKTWVLPDLVKTAKP